MITRKLWPVVQWNSASAVISYIRFSVWGNGTVVRACVAVQETITKEGV